MSFPPHDVIQSEALFYHLTGIADGVNRAIADTGLTAEVGHTPDLLQYLRVALPDGGAVSLAAITRFPGAWAIVWPAPGAGILETAWPLAIEIDTLVRILEGAVRHGVHGRELPSPFCWGRIEHSSIVELADQIVARGVDRAEVQLAPLRTLDDEGRPRSRRSGNELRLVDKSDPERTLVVRLDAAGGWAVDQVRPSPGASGRMDLSSALGLKPALPLVRSDEVVVGHLAQVLVEDTFWVDISDDDQRRLALYGQAPDEIEVCSKESAKRAATAWLLWAGFGDPADRWQRNPMLTPAIELHVDFAVKQVGIGGVQRAKGEAALGGRTPIIVARSGFSKNARDWADRAEMLLFAIDADGILHPANTLAHAHTPTAMGPRPRDCDDSACRTIGCVLEDEFCPSQWGRRSHPDAELWRL